ncbi:hypothetical protein IPG41_06085 [Candidatus Peregrinibacteria bacterium]|nr:MAG: hypothetical protein IPG41_06085 [Candidatus Peregrinibacteria bacterium]
MTTILGARRAIFLVETTTEDGFFLMFRSKNDPIGENMTIKNTEFKSTLHHYLELLNEDLLNQNFEIFTA